MTLLLFCRFDSQPSTHLQSREIERQRDEEELERAVASNPVRAGRVMGVD